MSTLPRPVRALGLAVLCAFVVSGCRNNEKGAKPDAAYFTAVAEKVARVEARADSDSGVRGLRNSADLKNSLRENDPRWHLRLRREGLRRLPGGAEGLRG